MRADFHKTGSKLPGILMGYSILCVLGGIASAQVAPPAKPIPEIPRDKLQTYLEVKAILEQDKNLSLAGMESTRVEGPKKAYTAKDVNTYESAEKAAVAAEKQMKTLTSQVYQGPHEFPWLSLRRSYRDVLSIEDPTLQVEGTTPSAKTFDDLQGALFSYNRDFKKDVDTWSVEGALLAPFSFTENSGIATGDPWTPTRFGIIPSVSYHRISTNGDPSGEVNQLTYRVGLFQKFESGSAFSALTVRAFGSYLTDAQHQTSVPAGEFEVEPQADFGTMFDNRVRIGYRTILIPKPESWQADEHDTALIAYQLRLLLHGEYVSVENTGSNPALKLGDAFRMGPIVQLDLKPFVFPRLGFSMRYSYLPALSGNDDHDSLFSVDAEWDIVKETEKRRKLSLKVSYLNGGLDLTKQKAEAVTVGLGATF